MPYGHKISTTEQRLNWLKDHPELHQQAKLVSLDGGTYRLFLPEKEHRRIAQSMKDAGLFAPSTYVLDIPVNKYVRILRGLR